MNKKGITLFETLGSLVILGITVTLLAFLITTFISANERISISSLANEEGHYIVRKIETELNEFAPTTFSKCPGAVCFLIEKEYEYVYNQTSSEIDLVEYTTPLEYKLQLLSDGLYINDNLYEFDSFTFSSDSTLDVVLELGFVYVNLNIVLESEKGDLFEFLMSFTYESSVIPSG